MFEQCLPYKDLSLEKELTCDVLIDDDDLLSQLSSQLDIPSFVDQGKAELKVYSAGQNFPPNPHKDAKIPQNHPKKGQNII